MFSEEYVQIAKKYIFLNLTLLNYQENIIETTLRGLNEVEDELREDMGVVGMSITKMHCMKFLKSKRQFIYKDTFMNPMVVFSIILQNSHVEVLTTPCDWI